MNFNDKCANYSCRTDRPTPRTDDEFDKLLREVRLHKINRSVVSLVSKRDAIDNETAIRAAILIRQDEKREKDNKMSEMNKEELFEHIESNQTMTHEEKKYAKLFYHETILVKDMDTLTLRAHIEELASIAKEAKTRYHAAKAEDDERSKKKSAEGKPSGFERSLNTDETATNAINKIKESQKRLSKKEQVQEGLKKLYEMAGNTEAAVKAEKVMQAGTILGRIQEKASEIDGAAKPPEKKPVFNPFAKATEKIEKKDE